MTKLVVLTGAGFIALSGSALAQPNPYQGTPESAFPHAAPNEVVIINGIPCRTILQPGTNVRVPVECREPGTTGSVNPGMEGGPPRMPGTPVYPPPQ